MTAAEVSDGLVWHGQRTSFTQIPDWLLTHPEIGADALRTWLVIASYAGKDMSAFPGVRTIGEKTGKGRSSIFRHLDELERAGALRRQERYRPDGGRTSTLYVLAWDFPLNAGELLHTPPSQKRDGGPGPTSETGARPKNGTTRRTLKKERENPLTPADTVRPITAAGRPKGGDPPSTPPPSARRLRRNPRALGANPRAVAAQIETAQQQTAALESARTYGVRMAGVDLAYDGPDEFRAHLEAELARGSSSWTTETIAAAVAAYAEVSP